MLIVNGERRSSTAGTVRELVIELTGRGVGVDGRAADGSRLGIAVARNGAVVPRTRWHREPLAEGDALEIITAKQGG